MPPQLSPSLPCRSATMLHALLVRDHGRGYALLFAGYAQAQRRRQDKREPPLARPAPEQAVGTGLAGPLLRRGLEVFLDIGSSSAAAVAVTARAVDEARKELHGDGEHDGGILLRCDGGQGL